jgi:protein ImuB
MHTLTAARPHLGVLERIGCRSWDDLLRLPRDGVARRFGAELLQALDRARGSAPDDYEWQVLPEHFEEKLELNALVTHAPALMAGVERLLVHLHAWLLGRQSGLCALRVTWHLDPRRDVPLTGELDIRTAQPAQDLRHVARLIAEHLAQQKLPAPVHSVSLKSLATELLADSAAATGSLLMEARKQGRHRGGAGRAAERTPGRCTGAGLAALRRPPARADAALG